MKQVKLYNVIFPVWFLLMLPQLWLVVIPGNFLIDSLVLLVAMYALKLEGKKTFYKQHIWKIFGFGFLADIIGAAYLFVTMLLMNLTRTGDEWYLVMPGVLIAAACIFLLNYFVSFRKQEKALRLKLALTFAIATAPYTFFIPNEWLYSF